MDKHCEIFKMSDVGADLDHNPDNGKPTGCKNNMNEGVRMDYCAACDKTTLEGCCWSECPFPKKGNQMTRQKAYDKLNGLVANPLYFIAALEILGLIKFDDDPDVKTTLSSTTIIMRSLDKEVHKVLDCVKELKKAGYEIVKVTKNAD